MEHMSPLIGILVIGLGLAFVLGTAVQRLGLPPLVGYLLAGVVVGPFSPGITLDQHLTLQLADIGVVLLMFGVGLHFKPSELLEVKAIVVPGAVLQMAAITALGVGAGVGFGWTLAQGLMFGLCLSVASTVVVMRALQDRRLTETGRGHIAIGWLVVQDLLTVLVLVILPPVADLLKGGEIHAAELSRSLGMTIGKLAVFAGLMLVIGRRVIPAILHYIAHTGSRELFRLAVLSVALSVAFAASFLFGVSIALGAFFGGMILAGSKLSQRAAEESLPLRDAFAVLFFVSVGMLLNPASLVRDPWPLLAVLFIIVIGKSLIAFIIVLAFRHPLTTALMISASLAQIGEFSFILAELGVALHLLPSEARDLILAGAIISIMLNPLVFVAVDWLTPRLERKGAAAPAGELPASPPRGPAVTTLTGHTIVVGYGRVGSLIAEALQQQGRPFLVIESSDPAIARLRERQMPMIVGNAAQPAVLRAANPAAAKFIVVAIPEAFEAGQIVQQARAANKTIHVIARAHS
ncbi:MAG TPA: cation:proton antiporter, partial [Candidatus Polarisedimenticolia bacterium]|nr:cation:proton antiporter [Candidatus Polarisedimenticolia bacterium]